jgi:superfamily I DNA/RNA helicase
MIRSGLDISSVMSSSLISSKLDMIHALEVLSDDVITSKELIDKIKGVFSDKKIEGISLSTIHKAKGLEANNVYIACNSLMPSKSATQDWEIEQEHNLMYVAYTRAKDKLGFLNEDEFLKKVSSSQDSLAMIEKQVNLVLGKQKTFIPLTKAVANQIVSNITEIKKPTIGQTTQLGLSKRQPLKLNTVTKRKLNKINYE